MKSIFNVVSEVESLDQGIRIKSKNDVELSTRNGILVNQNDLDFNKELHAVEAAIEMTKLVRSKMKFPQEDSAIFELRSDVVILSTERYNELIKQLENGVKKTGEEVTEA